MGMGALAGCALPGQANKEPRLAFDIAATYIPIVGSDMKFPVRRIYCIGRNYRAHAIEMGSNPDREPPFFFQKPTDAIQNVAPGTTVDHPYPSLTKNYHYEVELVAALQKGGKNIPMTSALEHVYAYALGLLSSTVTGVTMLISLTFSLKRAPTRGSSGAFDWAV